MSKKTEKTNSRPKVSFAKVVSLEFIDENQTDSFLKLRKPSYPTAAKLLALRNKADEDPEAVLDGTLNFIKESFIECKLRDESGELVNVSAKELEEVLPIEAIAPILAGVVSVPNF